MYIVQTGDTFELIARKEYGDDQRASSIVSANPGVAEPIVVGTTIVIPALQDDVDSFFGPAIGVDEVVVIINNKRFLYWQSITINESIDSIATVEFTAPFEADNADFRETFRPFSFKSVVIFVGQELIFTGTVVGVVPNLEAEKKTVAVSCYSKPGVLNDCTPPASSYPVEWLDINIIEVAIDLCKPFGVSVSLEGDSGTPFDSVACDPKKRVFQFLADLAKQRSLILSSDAKGKLVFQQSKDVGNPIAILRQGEPPLVSVTPSFSPQQYYSHITGLESVVVGSAGSQYTVKNPRLAGVIRPLAFSVTDALGGDVQTAVETKMGRMFGNMASYSIKVPSWRDPSGNLWRPNTTIKLTAPDAMIYNEYEFIIRTVLLKEDDSKTATLNLVIPGSFSGAMPEVLPWDE